MAALNKYIVTYSSRKIGLRDAAEILRKKTSDIRPVDHMLGPDIPAEDDATRHFEEPGFSLLPLSPEDKGHLLGHSAVKEVMLDFPVRAQAEVKSQKVLRPGHAASTETSLKKYQKELPSGQKILWNILKVGAHRVWPRATGRGVKLE